MHQASFSGCISQGKQRFYNIQEPIVRETSENIMETGEFAYSQCTLLFPQ